MSIALQEQLQATLGGAYTLERELGGGGMARVFVAQEIALGRCVVVKVLAPELAAGLSAERFAREVRLAARLQHPNIVPLLTAGERDGLAYYTMPFVEGESLRARLSREGRLPTNAATSILRDIMRALEYAHAHGVVHRDIKPDNVLLAGSAAAVADFGIAKAVQIARTAGVEAGGGGAHAETLTRVGTSIGTPAYMAPEQASGDPDVDARADVYAWGVVAYELLAGAPPFTGRGAHGLIAAQIGEPPPPLPERAPWVPPALAALVMRCLEKDPARRPQSATDVLRALDDAITPGAGAAVARPPSARRVVPARWQVGALVAVLVIAAGGLAAFLHARPTLSAAGSRRVAVAPFANGTGAPHLEPLGAMIADWITQGLAGTELVDAVPSGESLFAHEQAKARAAAADSPLLSTSAEETGARILVSGAYYRDGDSLRFQSQVTDGATGRVLRVVEGVSAAESRPLQGVELLRQRVIGALAAVTDPRLAQEARGRLSQPPDYASYRELMAGYARFFASDWAGAIPHLLAAAERDSGFATPRVLAATAYANSGKYAAADSLARFVARARDRVAPLDRAMLEWLEATLRGDWGGAYDGARRMQEASPASPFGAQAAFEALKLKRPRETVARLTALDPERGSLRTWRPYWMRLADALHLLGEHREELGVGRRGRALQPEHLGVHLSNEARALAALGRTTELRRLMDALPGLPGMDGAGGTSVMLTAARELRAHGHAAEARAMFDRLVAWDQRLPPDVRGPAQERWLLAQALAERGDCAAAATLLDRLIASAPDDLRYRGYAALCAAALGDRLVATRTDAWLAGLTRPYLRGEHTLWRARIAASLGERDRAVTLLRDAFAQGVPYTAALHVDHGLAPLHGYAPYDEMLKPKR